MSGRTCGSCTLCCNVFKITESGVEYKAAFEWCANLRAGCSTKACTIYAERPGQCASFRCLWLEGMGPAGMRPDRSGVVLLLADAETRSQINAHAISPERVTPKAFSYLRQLTEDFVVILRAGPGNRRVLGGPRRMMEDLMKVLGR